MRAALLQLSFLYAENCALGEWFSAYKKLLADFGGERVYEYRANYTRVLSTSCSGTGASIERGTPSTHWMAFFGHLETQVPQPLHLV